MHILFFVNLHFFFYRYLFSRNSIAIIKIGDSMKHFKYVMICLLLLFPCVVDALTREDIDINVDVCKSGCEYYNFTDVFNYVSNMVDFDEVCISEYPSNPKTAHFYNIIINIKDNNDYILAANGGMVFGCHDLMGGGVTTYHTRDHQIENVTIIGQGNRIITRSFPNIGGVFHFSNLNFQPYESANGNITNSLEIESASSYKQKGREDLRTSIIEDCDFSSVSLTISGNQNVQIKNTKISNLTAVSDTRDKAFSPAFISDETVNINTFIEIDNGTFINDQYKKVDTIPDDSSKSYLKTNCIADGVCSKISVYNNNVNDTVIIPLKQSLTISDLLGFDVKTDEVSVNIVDTKVLEYRNNSLYSVGPGTTDIEIYYNDDIYKYRISVVKENPKTSNDEIVNVPDTALQKGKKLIAIGIIFLILGLGMQLLIFKKVISKN